MEMIKPEELRIGNFIMATKSEGYYPKGHVYAVHSISKHGVNYWQDMGSSGWIPFSSLAKVPLTHDWLCTLGFSRTSGHYIHISHLSHIKIFPPGSPNNGYGIFVEGRIIGDVGFVHKLQNFWFEVIHEELIPS